MDRMRLVLDTNVILSALIFGGELQFVEELLEHGEITPCFSYPTWNELERVLHYPHIAQILIKNDLSSDDILHRLQLDALFVTDSPSPLNIPKDPNDEAILACAITARARAVVTGDQYLLSFAKKSPIAILTPRQMKNRWPHL